MVTKKVFNYIDNKSVSLKGKISSEANGQSLDNKKRDTGDAEHKSHQRKTYQNKEKMQQQPNSKNLQAMQSISENLEFYYKVLMELFKKISQQMQRIVCFILTDMGGSQLIDRLAQWCVQHPQMSICILVVGLMISFPFLLFVGFALSTVVMTLTGFLVLEGTLLTILTMIMFGMLGALGIVLLFFAVVGVTTYFGVSRVYEIYGSNSNENQGINSGNDKQGDSRN